MPQNQPVSYTCTYGNPRQAGGAVAVGGDNFNYASSTCKYTDTMFAPNTQFSTSTQIALYGSFTAGEILIALMTFIIIVLELGRIVTNGLDRVKTKKRVLAYNGGDVEIQDKI